MKNLFKKIGVALIMITSLFSSAQVGTGPAPYCMPLYSQIPCNQPNPSNNPSNFINDFIHSYNTNGATFNIVNNASGCNAQNLAGIKNYRLWGCQFYMVCAPGQVITSNFQSGNIFPQGATVFVDWNLDGVYNPITERMTSTAGVPPAGVMTPMPAWTVPVVGAGTYRMRVRCAYFTNGNTIDPCLNYGYGETEEYYVYVGISPPGSLTATLSSNSPVCTGNTLSLTCVASGTAAGTYTYTWAGPNGFTSTVMNPTVAATTSLQSGVYTVTVNPGSCPITQTINVTVNQTPTITSITNNAPVCQGSNVNITLNSTTSGTTSYSWNGPNSYTSNAQSPIVVGAVPANTGVYTVTVTNTFTGNATCAKTGTTSIVVVPVAQVSVTPSFTQCQGTNVNLVSNVNGASSYTWNGPGGYTNGTQNPVLPGVTPSANGNYTVTAYFTAMNTTLVCSSSAVSNVSVVPMNPVTAVSSANVCQNSIGTLSANALGSPVYNWFGPNSFTATGSNVNINNIQPPSSGNYTVNAVFSIGSVSCTTSSWTSISVVPVNTITVIPNITICNGEGTAFTANAPGAISYTWNGPGGFNVTQPNTQFTNLNPTWSGIYTVTAQFTNGNINCYSSNTTNLLVKPNIQFSLTPINKLCYNDNLIVPGPAGATSYTWSGPNFTSNTQNLNIPNVSTVNIGTYNVVVDLNGCKTYGSVFVDVNDPIKWKLAPNNITLCKGDSFTVTAEAEGGSGNYAYNWNPFYGITGPTGSVQAGVAYGTTVYNISVYDIACPQYTINHSFVLNVNKAPVPNLQLNTYQSCEPFCTLYDGKITNAQLVTYVFGTGNNSMYNGDSINVCLNAGTYTPTITTIGFNGCKESFVQNQITVYPKPNADFTWDPSTPNTLSDSYVLFTPSGQIMPITSYYWDFYGKATSTDKTPTHRFDEQGNLPIALVLTTDHGCKDTIVKVIQVRDEFLLFVPNAFTPNGDGLNDVFFAKGLGIKKFDMTIFDRWGNPIFQSGDIYKGWDGTFKGVLCPEDAYVYKINVTDGNGKAHTKTGHVTLLK